MENKLHSGRKVKMSLIIAGILAVILLAVGIVALASRLIAYGDDTSLAKNPEQEQAQEDEEVDDRNDLPRNTYSADGFYDVKDIRYYYAGGYEGIAGVDVSSYQDSIDWKKVREAGISFAIIRVGYRGWSSGVLDEDDMFHQHMKGALDAGLEVGVYFFSQALTEEEAIEEAQYTLEMIRDYDVKGPVVYDWEEVAASDARTNEMNMLKLTACAEAFCSTVEAAGYDAAVYFNQAYGYQQFNLQSLQDYTFWLAEYSPYPGFEYNFDIWQYTNEGTVPGIEGNVDLNIMFRKK